MAIQPRGARPDRRHSPRDGGSGVPGASTLGEPRTQQFDIDRAGVCVCRQAAELTEGNDIRAVCAHCGRSPTTHKLEVVAVGVHKWRKWRIDHVRCRGRRGRVGRGSSHYMIIRHHAPSEPEVGGQRTCYEPNLFARCAPGTFRHPDGHSDTTQHRSVTTRADCRRRAQLLPGQSIVRSLRQR